MFLMILMAAVSAQFALAESSADSHPLIGGERIELRFEPASVGEIKDQVIREDGTITLPTGSTVQIKDKTLDEAKKIIAEQLQKDTGARAVQVRILVLEYPPSRIFIAGEVRTPKSIALTSNIRMTLLLALLEAGGISEKGDPTRVTVMRVNGEGKGQNQVIDTTKLAESESGGLGPKLLSGDVIMVPPADHYLFNGEFNKPGYASLGELRLEPNEKPHLSRAIMGQGGLKRDADVSKLKILRLRPDGSREVLTPLADSAKPQDPILQNGDIVDLPAKAAQREALPTQNAQIVTVTGRVRSPGTFPIGESGLKLSRLILAAGGTTEFAKSSRVSINRPSEKGRLIVVDVDAIIKKGHWEQDVDLIDGDVVNVPERGY